MPPQTRYARSGDVSIAYQVVGDWPPDLVLVPGWVSNIEVFSEHPAPASFLNRLIRFDRTVRDLVAGSGLQLSDRGRRALKGIPGEWRLYSVDRGAS